jgi:hypothetical protein
VQNIPGGRGSSKLHRRELAANFLFDVDSVQLEVLMKRLFTRSGGLSTLVALAIAAFAVGTMFADDGDDDQKRNNGGDGVGNCVGRNNCADGVSGSGDDTRTSGEVLAINTLKDPHEITLGNIDGQVYVKFYGPNAPHMIKESGVKVKDYIEVIGWKENENVFWADSISARDENND